ncbi:hypothetical protein [Bradyrhizobium ganzhouense]|uniref:hypothetical protein n=1 Tax=Bradyrhizobium ganzhouense TaxID=1179767 RepID=UPI003CEBAFBF
MSAKLRCFWLKFDGDNLRHGLGYGVTAWNESDALQIVQLDVFGGEPMPPFALQADVDISKLDAGHILPNMESPNWRGIWYPRGYAKSS